MVRKFLFPPFQVSITLFKAICFGLTAIIFLIGYANELKNISSIQGIARNIEKEQMPKLIADQQGVITLGNLRRLTEVLKTTHSSEQIDQIRATAEQLSAEATLDTRNVFDEGTYKILDAIKDLASAKKLVAKWRERIGQLEQEYYTSILLLGKHATGKAELDLLLQMSTHDLTATFAYTKLALEEQQKLTQKRIMELRTVYASITEPAPEIKELLGKNLSKVEESLNTRLQLLQQVTEQERQIQRDWEQVDEKLNSLRANIAVGSEAVINTLLQSILNAAQHAWQLSILSFIILVVFLVGYCALDFLLITRPVQGASKKLAALQEGQLNISLPRVYIKEISQITNLLERFSTHLAELYHRASEMEEGIIQKHNLEEIMRAVFRASQDGYVVWNEERLISFSRGALDLFHFSSEHDATSCKQIQNTFQRHRQDVSTHIQNGNSWREEMLFDVIGSTTIPCEVTHIAINYNNEKCILSYIRDLREQKRYEADLFNAKSAAEAAAQAKSDFMARMSHEIRTPMNGVLGLVKLAFEASPNPKQKELLDKIQTSARILLKVINDILDFSKMEKGTLTLEQQPFSLLEVFDAVTDLSAPQASQKSIAFETAVDRYVLAKHLLIGDGLRLSQVLLNLCGNAIKFTEQGGVHFSVQCQVINDEIANVTCLVKDTGIGIPKSKQAVIFQSFSQADTSATRKHGGIGLGLMIAKQLVGQMGGELCIASTPGLGSEFYFTIQLPLANSAEVASQNSSAEQQGDLSKLTGKRVLVAEDNEINQEIIIAFLESLGMVVAMANNGEEALNLLTAQLFDFVILDIQMPVMDGLTAVRAIRAHEVSEIRTLPVIAMTAHALQEDKEKSIAAGMDAHLTKPIEYHRLVDCLTSYLSAQVC